MKKCLLVATLFYVSNLAIAQQSWKTETRANLLLGLNQPLLGGFNIEGNLFYHRWAFDYSHGISLNLDNEFLDPINKEQGLDVHIPWTTGFGVGYRFTEWLNLRAEPKWHKFELFYNGQEQTETNLIADYTTFSMGLGLYTFFRPFKGRDNWLQGLSMAPSIRWWPKVSSSLDGESLTYANTVTGQMETHEALEVGVNNTPLILNVSIGYSIGW